MFDASLADIADRQSSISSIFTYTFNIESFLKEKNIKGEGNNASLSMTIEEYLKGVFFKEVTPSKNIFARIKNILKLSKDRNEPYGRMDHTKSFFDQIKNSLKLNKDGNEPHESMDHAKVIFTLQKFIDYLTYRTNGSPKKLIKIVHEFITVGKGGFNGTKTTVIDFIGHKNKSRKKKANQEMYLYFNYNNQYRIGFISYLYRPFLIQYGRSFKSFSDNIIVSTPYLFDHLLKFHPFGFSLSNLELIPEVLSTSKTPFLQEHITNIIDYLGENHIRKTEIGLFDYKFYSRTLNEISFISKLFEEESAAFNFTLDESYLVKIYLRGKIKELRSIYSKFIVDPKEAGAQQIFSISHLNGKLGDLHFFDQEYDDAIVSYSDAIRPINNLKIQNVGMRDFITLIRNKLKLGLCFEKINSYDEALSFYSDCCQDAKRFIMQRLKQGKEVHLHGGFKETDFYHSSSLNDLLQIVIQGFLATIIVEEKMGVEGITTKKLGISLGNFLKIAENVDMRTNCGKNNLIIANAYLVTGKLFYFKNTAANINHAESKHNELRKDFINFPPKIEQKLVQLSNTYDELLTPFDKSKNQLKRKPTTALYMYIMGICEVLESKQVKHTLFDKIVDCHNVSYALLIEVKDYLNSEDERLLGYHYRYIATFLSSIGDALWAMCEVENYKKVTIAELFDYRAIQDSKADDKDFDYYIRKPLTKTLGLPDVLRCYYLAGQFFKKYGRSVSCSYQYRKILYVLKTVIHAYPFQSFRQEFLDMICSKIVQPVLEITSQNGGHADRHMIKKGKKMLNDTNIPFIMNNISNHPDTKEAILLFKYISIKVKGNLSEIEMGSLVSNHNSIGTQFSRLAELDLFAKYTITKIEAKKYGQDEKGKYIVSDQEEFSTNAIDYLYSMLSMLRIQKIYGNDFVIGHSSFAYTHLRLARFLKRYPIDDSSMKIKEKLDVVMDKGSYTSVDATYHYQLARDLYTKAIQLHTAGNEYKKTIGEMVYLEDDFNDNAYHFGAALNRYLMINGDFKDYIKECDLEIATDPYYQQSYYFPQPENDADV
jgi:hypothetical protein